MFRPRIDEQIQIAIGPRIAASERSKSTHITCAMSPGDLDYLGPCGS